MNKPIISAGHMTQPIKSINQSYQSTNHISRSSNTTTQINQPIKSINRSHQSNNQINRPIKSIDQPIKSTNEPIVVTLPSAPPPPSPFLTLSPHVRGCQDSCNTTGGWAQSSCCGWRRNYKRPPQQGRGSSRSGTFPFTPSRSLRTVSSGTSRMCVS